MSNQSAFNSHHLEQVIALQGEELLESCSAIKCPITATPESRSK